MRKTTMFAMKDMIEDLIKEYRTLIKVNKIKIPEYCLCNNYFQDVEDILRKGEKKRSKIKHFNEFADEYYDSDGFDDILEKTN